CEEMVCSMHCENGFKVDSHGCNTCECYECPAIECRQFCSSGFKRDTHGCQTCECNEEPQTCDEL
ncbi:hypothetical protein CAPTEDRAFT_69917, partial [Capitella teleta]